MNRGHTQGAHVLVVDFGSQVSQLIVRSVRESGVYCVITPFDKAAEHIKNARPEAIILSGGPASATDAGAPRVPQGVFDARQPVLGICYGQQAMCLALGGAAVAAEKREFGAAQIRLAGASPLFDGFDAAAPIPVWMSHADRVEKLPDGFEVIAASDNAPFAAIADETRHFYGVQFHPEVAHTPGGRRILKNFTHGIAGCRGDWTMDNFATEARESIRGEVGDGRVICALSGGVDSSVAAVLLHKAIGAQLTCVFVDNGLLRAGEAKEVETLFGRHFNIPLISVDAGADFLAALAGVSDPEQKRRIIGRTFIDVFEAQSRRIGNVDFLAQGTLYPDVIESVPVKGAPSALIKSHHNVGGLPARMKLRLVEPLRELFKDEVRALGRLLNLPRAFLRRHPFPGPGLAVRMPGHITEEKLAILRRADGIYLDEIRKAGLYDEIWQAFAVLLPVRAVGVMGDARTYDYVCALRAVVSEDAMTAEAYGFTPAFLGRVATRIVNETPGINRVVYDITSKPPGSIEWE